MKRKPTQIPFSSRCVLLLLTLTLVLPACSQMGAGVRFAVNNINDFRRDATIAWHDFKHFRAPPQIKPQPQLRYCYDLVSDIVCYDAPQTTTAPLVGVQEGVPGRLIAGAQVIDDASVYAETAPEQYDVTAEDLAEPQDVGLLPDNSLPPSVKQTATFAN